MPSEAPDHGWVEGLPLAGGEAALIEPCSDLSLGMMIEEPVDLAHDIGTRLSELPRRGGERQWESVALATLKSALGR